MNLYHLNAQYQQALEAITVDEATGELLGIDALNLIEDDIKQKLLNYGKYIKSLQAEHQAYKEEKSRVEIEMRRRDKKISALKDIIASHLNSDDKLEDTQCRLSYRKSKCVTVDAPDLLPDEFIDYTPKINKSALKTALSNQEIAGAHLETVQHLQIK